MRYRIVLERNARIDYRVQPTMRPLNAVPVTLESEPGGGAATPITGTLLNLLKLPS